MATIKLYKKSKQQPCYRLSYRDPQTSKWRQKLLHCSRDEAEEIRKRLDAEHAWYQINPHLINNQELLPFEIAKERFLNSKLHVIEHSTYKRYERVFKSLENFIGNPAMSEITGSVLTKYAAAMLKPSSTRETGRSPAGVNLDLRHIKAFLRYCNDEGLLKKAPKIVMLKEKKRPIYFITKKQFQDWYKSCDTLGADAELVRDIATIVLFTAARISEILTANWDQIDLNERVIKLFDEQDDDIGDKTNSGGNLYLNDKACDILKKYIDNTPGPFTVNYDWFQWRMRKVALKTELRLRPHDLRKTAGSWLVQDGVDIYQVSKFMRHTSVIVTEKFYADLMTEQYHETADQMANFL
jgi:integrase